MKGKRKEGKKGKKGEKRRKKRGGGEKAYHFLGKYIPLKITIMKFRVLSPDLETLSSLVLPRRWSCPADQRSAE